MKVEHEHPLKSVIRLFWLIFSIATAMIGYSIHHSFFWAIVDCIFSPIVWAKWLICHEVNMTVIKTTFQWFFT